MAQPPPPTPPSEPGRPLSLLVKIIPVALGFAVLAAGALALVFRLHAAAADRAVLAHDLESAQFHIDRCLTLRPHSPALHLEAARIARRRDDLSLAERQLAAVGRPGRPTPEVDLEQRLLRAQRGDLQEVEKPLKDLLQKRHPDEILILEALSAGYIASGRFPEAKGALDEILEKDPNDVPALLLRAQVFASVPKAEVLSLPDLRHAVDVAPASSAAQQALGQTLLRQGYEREALGHFEWVRRQQPDLPEVLLGLAACRFDAGDKAEAARLLDHLLERQPDHPAGLVERGRLALCEGQPARAEELCRHALRVAHKDAVAWQVLALALASEGRGEESAQALDENCRIEGAGVRLRELSSRLEDEPNDPDLYVQIAAAYLTLDRAADAERALRQALVFDPSHANAHQMLRELRRRTNMLTPSIPTKP